MITYMSVIWGQNDIIIFGQNLPFPFLQGMERCWDSSQYSDSATGWIVWGSNPERGK
jgi:hypothetical protein